MWPYFTTNKAFERQCGDHVEAETQASDIDENI
jgi:hypothetical protein